MVLEKAAFLHIVNTGIQVKGEKTGEREIARKPEVKYHISLYVTALLLIYI